MNVWQIFSEMDRPKDRDGPLGASGAETAKQAMILAIAGEHLRIFGKREVTNLSVCVFIFDSLDASPERRATSRER